jgi:hypothetical protein
MTQRFLDSWQPQTGTRAKARRLIRLAAVIPVLALLGACVNGGSDAPTTNVDNTVPVASAGADQTVFTQAVVNLNGGASSDTDGDNLSFSWDFQSRPSGSTASLANAATVSARFTPDVAGTYVVRLSVADGFPGGTATDTVTVTANVPPPLANAGPDQNITFAEPSVTVQLNGSASSDPSNLPLTYAWEILSFVPSSGVPPANDVSLVAPDSVNASFIVTDADQSGTYTLRLTVNNGSLTASDDVIVRVATIPAPVANAGPDQEVAFAAMSTTVTLDGTGSSDPSSLPLAYAWEILSFVPASGNPPAASAMLVGATTDMPTFDINALDQLGTYTIGLTVSNGTLESTDEVVVTVAKSFPAAGALLGGGAFAFAGAALRRRWRQWRSARQLRAA